MFDEICSLPEYYQTRTELRLLRAHGAEIGALVGPGADVVELGAGSSRKARLLRLERSWTDGAGRFSVNFLRSR